VLARRRFFVDAIVNGIAEVRGDQARHLARVLRAERGQQYEISDNRTSYLAEVVESHAGRVLLRVIEPLAGRQLPARVTLCAALIKFDRFEWIIEKATELGVERIIPVEAARSENGLRDAARKRADRWVRVARESSQQSRRARMPEILPAASFPECLALAASWRYFLDEEIAPALLGALPESRSAGDTIALLVGPEGGWTGGERAAAVGAGWLAVSLGPLILRAETAAAAAMAIIGNAWLERL